MNNKEKLEKALKLTLELEKSNQNLSEKLNGRGFVKSYNADMFYDVEKMAFLVQDIEKVLKSLT